jgi:hypothetical protein
LYKLFARKQPYALEPRYEDSVARVYTDFAMQEYRAGDLELLRYCGSRMQGVLSWVPDWSVDVGSMPLPSKRNTHYFGVPWWLQPPDDDEFDADIEIRLSRAEDPTKYNAPPYKFRGYWFHGYAEDPKQTGMERLVKKVQLQLHVDGLDADETCVGTMDRPVVNPRTNNSGPGMLYNFESKGLKARKSAQLMGLDSGSALVRRGEYITRRQQERQVLQNLDEDPTRPRYSAGRSTYPLVRIDDNQATLACRGVIWDVIYEMHDEPFPSDIEAEWQNATIFMVAVGGSKKRASDHPSAVQRYPPMHQRMRAFWSTLMVGVEQRVDSDTRRFEEEFTSWLPELNGTWCTAAPPLTHITSGLVGLSEVEKVQLETVEQHESSSFRLGPSSWTAIVDGADPQDDDVRSWNLARESSLTPGDWTCAEISHYR